MELQKFLKVISAIKDIYNERISIANTFQIEGNKWIATDGMRLLITQLPYAFPDNFKITASMDVILMMYKILKGNKKGNVEVIVEDNKIIIDTSTKTFEIKDEGLHFPNYREVMPKEEDYNVLILCETKDFTDVIKRSIAVYSNKDIHKYIKLVFTDPQRLTIETKYSKIKIPATIIKKDCTLEWIAYNSQFLYDASNRITDFRIEIKITNDNNPTLVKQEYSEDIQYIIMPMDTNFIKKLEEEEV